MVFNSFIFSMPAGNPSFPSLIKKGFFISQATWFNFRVGYEGNFVRDRLFLQNDQSKKKVDDFKKYSNSVKGVFNILKRLDIYGTWGENKIEANWIIEEMQDVYSFLEIESKYSNCWSCGGKAIFFEWGNTTLSLGGGYSYTNPKILYLIKNGEVDKLDSFNINVHEWQVDMGISYKIDMFVPYVLAKYSKAKAKLAIDNCIIGSNFSSELYMKSKNNFG
ncbi:MAG: hypothetical protein AMS24_04985, partial [Chlamydiae bacterium SM23_39]